MSHRRKSGFQRMTMITLAFLLVFSMFVPTNGMFLSNQVQGETEREITVGEPRPDIIHEDLRSEMDVLSVDEQIEVMVMLEDEPDLDGIRFNHDEVVDALHQTADESQEVAMRYIEEVGGEVLNTFWLSNMILAEVTPDALEEVTRVTNVEELVPNFEVQTPEPQPVSNEVGGAIVDDLTWGLDMIEADRVWNELGIDGSGVQVAVLDTGVAIDHPDLADKMATDDPNDPQYPGGWMEFDSSGNPVASEPYDSGDHGTHVAGTVLGGDESGVAIGVAPEATQMHGLVLPGGGGSFAQVTAGMEWAVDPFDANGNPAGEPADVVNMSLGADGYEDQMVDPTRNMYYAGIFPAFSIGNSGEGLSGSPGNVYEAVGVGATDSDDNVASFSGGEWISSSDWSNAPEDWPDEYLKPDISAPGVDVWSAHPGGDYRYASGTSMSAPHMAGTAALMLSAAPELSVDDMLQTLQDTAYWDDRYAEERPDIRYGYGRINAFDAVSAIAYDSGIEGTVVDAETGDPLAQATVEIEETGTTLETDQDGTFTARLAPDTYTLNASRFGYDEATASDIEVTEEQFIEVEISLQSAPTGSVEGTVMFDLTDSGIPGAEVEVLNVPIALSGESDVDGQYVVEDIPEGSYELQASAPGLPSSEVVEVTVEADETASADFVLTAPENVAVLGDHSGNTLTGYLNEGGYDAEAHSWDSLGDPAQYSAIIVNRPGDPGEGEFMDFIEATDAAGTGVVFLDTWSTSGNGVYLLNEYLNNPEERSTGFSSSIDYLYYEVIEEHPILEGFEPGEEIIHDDVTNFKDHASFDGYEGEGREVIAYAGRDDEGILGPGIGVHDRGDSRHVLLSMHGNSTFIDTNDWTEETSTVFLNAIDWVSPDLEEDAPRFALWNLSVNPEEILHHEDINVSAGVKNIGNLEGEYEAELQVNGETEDSTTVHLDPAEDTTVEFDVNRTEVGTYTVQIGSLTETFEVRPPQVSVEAYAMQANDEEWDRPGPPGRGNGSGPPGRGNGEGPPGQNQSQDADSEGDLVPLDNATVDIILSEDEVITVGQTDEEGQITFDSTGSIEEYTMVIHREETDDHDYQYLLTQHVTVDDDMTVDVVPHADTHTQVDIGLDAVHEGHEAVTFLGNDDTMSWAYAVQPGTLVVEPHTYFTTSVHEIDDLVSTWVYQTQLAEEDWTESRTYDYQLGGEYSIQPEDIRGQEAPDVKLNWAVTDAYDHAVALIGEIGPEPFEVQEMTQIDHISSHLADQAESIHEPVLRQYDPRGDEVRAGTVSWDAQPFEFSMDAESILPGSYTHNMEVNTGPYSGNITGEASMVLPARGLATETVSQGDSFEVTVVFDTPEEAHDAISLTEQLPEGFEVTDWSSSPNIVHHDYADGTWTWNESGRSSYDPGELVEITYEVQIEDDIESGEYSLNGFVTDHDSDAERQIVGQTTVMVEDES